MSNRWFYEIDGQVVGPVEQTRLRLLADSGMLQPQHKVRREDQRDWFQAATVRGLFASTTTPTGGMPMAGVVATSVPVARPVAVVPAVEEESPFGNWSAPTSEIPVPAGVFDFFGGSEEPAAPSQSKPAARPVKAAKPVPPRRAPEPPKPAPPPVVSPEPPIPEVEAVEEMPFPAAGTPAPNDGASPFAFESPPAPPSVPAAKLADSKLAPKPVAIPESLEEPAFPANLELSEPVPETPAPATPKPSQTEQAPTNPAPAHTILEVTGQAVELLPDDTLRPLDGKTSFRLHRAWLLATTRYSDGTIRIAYLRLQGIDAGVIEQRYESGRGREGPHAALVFHAGELTVGLLFQGSDKPYRTFIEKVLLHGSTPKNPAPQKG